MQYRTSGTCSMMISFDVDENDAVRNVSFLGGCDGNLKGIGKLVEGRKVDEVIGQLDGIRCGRKPTSCPDQLARALKQYRAEKKTV